MRRALFFVALTCCLLAQDRRPGLWELTSTQTWQQSPFPAGMTPPSTPRTTKVCLTQEQIDKYGAIVPQTRGCQVSNIVKKPGGMTAVMTCSGVMNGKATMESHLTDADHALGKMHFTGSMRVGQESKPVDYMVDSSSVFKSADCGDVKRVPVLK